MSTSYISDLSSQIITYIGEKDYESVNILLDESLNNIINNRYLLWYDGKKDIPQFFKDYDCKLYRIIL